MRRTFRMVLLKLNPGCLLAAADPSAALWPIVLVCTAIVAVFVGWVLARRLRLHYFSSIAEGRVAKDAGTDAWDEASARLDEDDPGYPPQPPMREPDPRWQT